MEVQEKLELGHKRVKVLELESPFCNQGIYFPWNLDFGEKFANCISLS